MRRFLPAAALALIACTTTNPAPEPADSVGACQTDRLNELVGQLADAALASEALRRSGARGLRWIRPGDMVTMDYRGDRLNIHLDGDGRVERFACG